MIIYKSEKEIEILKEGGEILSNVLNEVALKIEPGITTGDLENIACGLIEKAGGRPSFKGYKSLMDSRAFPTALCTSINEEVVHAPALPPRELKEGDIIGIDLGMEYPFGSGTSGYYTDMARTIPVGNVGEKVKKLLSVTEESLYRAIEAAIPGNSLNDIGKAIQAYVEANGFSVVRDLVGHGVGIAVHEDPQVPNYEIKENRFKNEILKKGMVIAIEPMVNMGAYRVKNLPDGFTIATEDGGLSAHFEHTIAIREKDNLIITNQ